VDRDIFLNLSPIDSRYYKSSKELLDELSVYLSEKSMIKYEALVETSIISVMERYGLCKAGSVEQMKNAYKIITPKEVYKEEEITKHNIRALVNVLQRYVDDDIAPFIHLSATSEDITGTAQALRFKDVFFKVVIPKALELLEVLLLITKREATTVQIGRTHGQHAVPITVGYAFGGYVDRFGGRLLKIVESVKNLKGKISGAVGSYNASSLLFDDPRRFEEDVLSELGLKPSLFSSQIVEPEFMLDLVHSVISAFGVLAQISDDIRHLQRTEISELGEAFEKGQVGSSTMPHKRNPWNFEHVKSMWKAFMPRIITNYLDQISEHQRDLTNSASNRFTVEIIAGFALSIERLTKQLKNIIVDYDSLQKNLSATKGMFLAEPLYILLASKGIKNAHSMVKAVTLKAEKQKKTIFGISKKEKGFENIVKMDKWKILEKDPSNYTGKAEERAISIYNTWKSRLKELRNECNKYKEVNSD